MKSDVRISMNLEPISSETVVNEVLKRITDSIMRGELLPGEKLPTEVELMERLNVGRNSVREAIKMLSAMGVLEVRRGNGTYVATSVSPAIFNPLVFSLILEAKTGQDLYELRTMFESMVLFVVIDKATEEDIQRLELLLGKVQAAYQEGVETVDFFVQEDVAFHRELLNCTKNPLIARIGGTIIDMFPNYIRKSILQTNGISRALKNHRDILNVIRGRDKQRIFETIEQSLAEWKREWKE